MLNFGFPGYVESNHAGIGPLKHVQRFAPDETGAAGHEGDARRETHSTEEAYKSAALVQNAKRNLATASASESCYASQHSALLCPRTQQAAARLESRVQRVESRDG